MIHEKKLIEELRMEYECVDDLSDFACGAKRGLVQAISIIKHQPKVGEWIPVEERLPEEKKFYEENMRSPACLVTVLSDDELMVGIDHTVNGVWTLEETFDKPKIIAWLPLPEPYSSGD